jgi:hypothetical protein
VQWMLTGMLIIASAAIAAYTGYLVRRLFTLDPGTPQPSGPAAPTPTEQGETP